MRASHDHLVGSLSLWTKLRAHSGCVNTISWCADDPSLLASGSDDTRVLVWRVPPRISADDPLRPEMRTRLEMTCAGDARPHAMRICFVRFSTRDAKRRGELAYAKKS